MHEDVYWGDGLNLHAYCRNNPVIYYDPSGYRRAAGEFYIQNPTTLAQEIAKEVYDFDYSRGNKYVTSTIGPNEEVIE